MNDVGGAMRFEPFIDAVIVCEHGEYLFYESFYCNELSLFGHAIALGCFDRQVQNISIGIDRDQYVMTRGGVEQNGDGWSWWKGYS
jgi:hypothetical protein